MNQADLVTLARKIAANNGMDDALVCAIIEQESSWNQWAYRFEPGFYEHYVKGLPGLTPTEAYARSFSWGLMQVMGQVAREHHFEGALTVLCDPAVGIDMGCKVLKDKINAAGGNIEAGLLRWNGGANPAYPAQVLARKPRYQQSVELNLQGDT